MRSRLSERGKLTLYSNFNTINFNKQQRQSYYSLSIQTPTILLSPILSLLLLLLFCIIIPLQLTTTTTTSTFNLVNCFNVDTNSSQVFRGTENSYFGYSVALHKDQGSNVILVGAPKQVNQGDLRIGGALFKCEPFSSIRTCQQVLIEAKSQKSTQQQQQQQQDSNSDLDSKISDRSNQWLGATLHSASGDNGTIVICAPNYVYLTSNHKRREPVGTCWMSTSSSLRSFVEFSPCRIDDQWNHNRLGSCQAGFSSAISTDGQRVLIGAPGSHVWQGQVFARNQRTATVNETSSVNPHSEDDSYLGYSVAVGKVQNSQQSTNNNNRKLDSRLDFAAIGMPRANDLAGKVVIVDNEMRVLRNISGEQVGSYFGYALVVADINNDALDDLIISAPFYFDQKSNILETGRVYVALQQRQQSASWLSGGGDDSFAQRFEITSFIDGHTRRGMFGIALANVGDLNRDGYQDIAIGAPNDGPDNNGAVYIYNGRPKIGLQQNPDQVIYASDIPQRADGALLRSFGWSISSIENGLDVDNNNYPDILVGDYESSRAILLRTRPVVNVASRILFDPEFFNLDEKNCVMFNSSEKYSCIKVQYCFTYTGLDLEKSLKFVYDIKLDSQESLAENSNAKATASYYSSSANPALSSSSSLSSITQQKRNTPRLFFDPTTISSRSSNRATLNQHINEDRVDATLERGVEQCKYFKAYIEKQFRDKLTPLTIDIDYNLQDSTYATTNKLTPILNKNVKNRISKTAFIQKNCGSDNKCVPDLKLTMSSNSSLYVVGSGDRISIDVTVKNFGEDAFESVFYLQLPPQVNYIKPISSNNNNNNRSDSSSSVLTCLNTQQPQTSSNGALIACDLANPQARNEVIKFSILTEPKSTLSNFDDLQSTISLQQMRLQQSEFIFKGTVNSTNPESIDTKDDNFATIKIQLTVNVDLSLNGTSYPSEVWHNITQSLLKANSKSQSNSKLIKSEEDIGQEVVHQYTILNQGLTPINDIAVALIWPQVRQSDSRFLLYLVDEPITSSKVRCKQSNNNIVNPLKFDYKLGNNSAAASRELRPLKSDQYINNNKFVSQQILKQNLQQTTVDLNYIQQFDSFYYSSFANSLACSPGKCVKFECNIYNLNKNELATIVVRSRISEDALNNPPSSEFSVASRLIIQVKELPFNLNNEQLSLSMYKNYHEVKTNIRIVDVGIGLEYLPWWVIVLSIILGIFLLVVLAMILRCCGFFERQRPPRY